LQIFYGTYPTQSISVSRVVGIPHKCRETTNGGFLPESRPALINTREIDAETLRRLSRVIVVGVTLMIDAAQGQFFFARLSASRKRLSRSVLW
jgi:hypothetical protein